MNRKTVLTTFRLSPLLLIAGYVFPAWAAPVLPTPGLPNAGSFGNQLRQQQQAPIQAPTAPDLQLPSTGTGGQPAANDTATVIVKSVKFSGLEGTTITEQQAQQAIADMLNKPLNFAGLQQMALKITELSRQHNMPLAQAILPPQTIADGLLQIELIPGRYDKPVVNNASALRSGMVRRMLRVTTPQGQVVHQNELVRTALLLNDIPGVESHVILQPGTISGTSALNIELKPGKRFGGYLALDNQGNAATGRSRVMLGGYANELLGIGDQLQVNLLDAYEKSGMLDGSLDYSALAGPFGTRLGANYSHLHYHYNLSGSGFSGYSDNWNVYASQPWIRNARARVDVRLEGGQQYLTDIYPQDIVDSLPGANGDRARRVVSSGGLSFQGSVASTPGGLSVFTLRGTVGNTNYRNPEFGIFQGTNTAGTFARFNYQLSQSQRIWGPVSVFASVNGQMANHNLDSSQKLLLGGPDGVRAYDIGDGSVDSGQVLTAELRSQWQLPINLIGGNPDLTLAAFYDQGWGLLYKDNNNPQTGTRLADENRVNLAGAGIYASLSVAGNYAITLTWARRTGEPDPQSRKDDRNRVWLSAVKTF